MAHVSGIGSYPFVRFIAGATFGLSATANCTATVPVRVRSPVWHALAG